MQELPDWVSSLDKDEVSFVKNFIFASGSLKEIAKIYEVSYPTIRLRLDRIIQKIKLSEDSANDPFIKLIKKLAIDEKMDVSTASLIIDKYTESERE